MLEWQELTRMTSGDPVAIETVRVLRTGIQVKGAFALPPLAQLTFEDQVFVAAFVRCHGSIKEMESSFGISYPTVKNRLNKIAGQLGFVTAEAGTPTPNPAGAAPTAAGVGTRPHGASTQAARLAVLDQLSRGEITVDAAVAKLQQG